MTETIQQLKEDIAILQQKLKALEKQKSPVEEAYKNAYGYYPDMEYNMNSFSIFQKGYEAAQEDAVVNGPYCPDEPEYYDEVEWDEKDNPKPMDDVVNRLIEKHKSQKLWNILSNKYDYISATCDDIVSAVEEWLPDYQNASGSQNVNTELLVEGFNHCLDKIKGMLR